MSLFDSILKQVGKQIDKKIGSGEFTSAINTALKKKDEAIYGSPAAQSSPAAAQSAPSPQSAPTGDEPVKGTVFDYSAPHDAQYSGSVTSAEIKADGSSPIKPYTHTSGSRYKFEIPENFLDTDSGAAEAEDVCIYTPETVTDENYDELCERFTVSDPVICVYTALNAAYYGGMGYEKNGVPGRNTSSKEQITLWEDVNGKCGIMLYKAKVTGFYDKELYIYGFSRQHSSGSTGHYALALEYGKDIIGTPLEEKLHRIFDHAAETFTVR